MGVKDAQKQSSWFMDESQKVLVVKYRSEYDLSWLNIFGFFTLGNKISSLDEQVPFRTNRTQTYFLKKPFRL